MDRQLWGDDDELMDELGQALRDAGALHDAVVADGRAAWTWRGVDAELELASLLYDSCLEESAAVRGEEAPPARLLMFEGGGISVEVEVSDQSLIGQVLPPAEGEVALLSPDGAAVTVTTDDVGCFTLPLPTGPVRLRARTAAGSVLTEWLRP